MSTPEIEDSLWNTLELEQKRRNDMRTIATPEQAQRVGDIHRKFPSLSPGVKLAAAKGDLTDEQIIEIAKKSLPVQDVLENQKPKQKSWFERNIQDKVKTASRYGLAGLNFVPQSVVGGAAQIFDTDDSISGFIISTDLGSLIANDEEAGNGFIIGGRAAELQAERARRYRGTINNSAYTLGRGIANVLVKPYTVPYRLISGAIDFATAIAVPSIPAIGVIGKVSRGLQDIGEAGPVVSKVADISRTVGRGSKEVSITRLSREARDKLAEEAGLLNDTVDIKQANRFFNTATGRRIIQRTAETEDFDETWQLWGKKIDPETAQRLADSKTEGQVMGVLLDVLGTQVTNTSGLSGGRRLYASTKLRNELIDKIPFGEGTSRAFAKLPRTNINLFQAETPREQIEQLDTVDRVLKLFKISGQKLDKDGKVIVEDLRKDFINRAGKLVQGTDEIQIQKFYQDLQEEMNNTLVRGGTPREAIDEIYKRLAMYKDDTSIFTADALGVQEDMGLFRKINNIPDGIDDDIVITGGLSAGELGTKEFFVPDPKQFRRLTNDFNWIWVKKDPNLAKLGEMGQLRLPVAVAEYIQEQIWRKYITATIGNFVRNTIDSASSLYLSGKGAGYSALRHPFEWFQMVGNERFGIEQFGRGDLMAQDWDVATKSGMVGEAIDDYKAATGNIVEAYFKDPLQSRRAAQRLGQFKTYMRRTDIIDQDFVRAHGDELGRLNADWSYRMIASGRSIDEIIDMVRDPNNTDAAAWFKKMKTSFKNGKPAYNKRAGETTWDSIDLGEEHNLRYLLEASSSRIQKMTGNDPELLDVIGLGLLRGRQQTVNGKYLKGDLKPGGRVEVTTFRRIKGRKVTTTFLARVEDSVRTAKGEEFTVTPYAFDGIGDNTDELRKLLSDEKIYKNPNMPRSAVGELRNPDNARQAALMKSMDRMITSFYSNLYTKPIAFLERSPAFRTGYYEWIDKLSQSLDEASLNKIIDDISSRTSNPETYLTPKLWAKLQDLKANPDKLYGTLNAQEVSSYASGAALDEYMKTVYNAVDRRNFTDVMRFISPFAQQHAEFMGRLGRLAFNPIKGGELGYLPRADAFRKASLLIEGGKDADPDGDGKGIFFKDPRTGELSFQFPFTSGLSKMITGIDAPLSARLKGVALGFDMKLGLGPFATVAASQILTDSPSLDSIRKVLLPYGERNDPVQALVPSWVTKVYEGVTGKSDGRFFGNMVAETTQALAATGKYDLSNENERDRLLNDAREKAKILSILRGVTQFTGPAAGDVDIKVPTEQGDVYANGLASALQTLRNINYETSTLRFIEIFGEDAFTYLSSKTTSEVGGLMSSKEFGVFERQNKSLFRQYKDVAGYFGPIGTSLDFEVYTRQLESGSKKRLSPEEILKASDRAIGLAYYKDMKEYLGPKLNKQTREYLAEYKKKIIEQYPGFGETSYDPQKTPRDIEKLFRAAKLENLEGNQTAQAVNYYEKVRTSALEEANRRGFDSLQSDSLVDLHEYLNGYAEALIEQYPDFARVYDRLLSKEID